MSELIKREDAIEAVSRFRNIDGISVWHNGIKESIRIAIIEDLAKLPSAEAVQGWIPCSERLPSESGWYLITVQGCEKVADMGWYYGERDVWEGVSSEQQVIAWMPLPEPYKGGD